MVIILNIGLDRAYKGLVRSGIVNEIESRGKRRGEWPESDSH